VFVEMWQALKMAIWKVTSGVLLTNKQQEKIIIYKGISQLVGLSKAGHIITYYAETISNTR
jgi:hypothetical protein